jgi:FkbM family methyltransferase
MKTWTYDELYEENEKYRIGWQYTAGEAARLKALWKMVSEQLTETNADAMALLIQTMFDTPAERFQDVFVQLYNGCKSNGYFVDFGACDGVFSSNTLMLERSFGWKGILVEPLKYWHKSLKKNRSAILDKRCVSALSGQKILLHQSARPGNSSLDAHHPYLGHVETSYKVESVSLLDLLNQHKAPKFIDFLSIDTEGHEYDILKDFDFDQYQFGFICVEEHEQVSAESSLKPILKAAGYEFILPRELNEPLAAQITGVDMFFVPQKRSQPCR